MVISVIPIPQALEELLHLSSSPPFLASHSLPHIISICFEVVELSRFLLLIVEKICLGFT
jgi:hypothetical protein